MKQETALNMLRAMLKSTQRFRSITMETTPENVHPYLPVMHPWIFGDKCILPALSDVIDRAETSGLLRPRDFFNMMTVLYQFTPEVVVVAAMAAPDILPRAALDHMAYLRGWD